MNAMTKAGQRGARREKTFNSQPGWNEHACVWVEQGIQELFYYMA